MTGLRIALVGSGAIGSEIATAIARSRTHEIRLTALVDTDREKAETLSRRIRPAPRVLDLDQAIQQADLIVEAANRRVVPDLVTKAVLQGKDVLLMSAGGLVDHFELFDLARRKNCCIYLPSGAVAGLDGLKSAMAGGVDRVCLTTTKPPAGLIGAPYFQRFSSHLKRLRRPGTLFRGSARQAVRWFPANVNVCVSVALAGLGLDRTQVVLKVDPGLRRNCHELMVEGRFGRLFARTENAPSTVNPRTSFLAAFSAIATLRRIVDPIKIGT